MRAFIYLGGDIAPEFITEHPKGDDLTIAADSGYKNAQKLGDKPSIIVGDFDSFPAHLLPEDAEIIKLKPEKDVTDAEVAARLAIERGATNLMIIGGLSGRLDHTLANLALLESLATSGIYAVMNDGFSRARYINSSSALIGRSGYKYISVIAASDTVKGLSIEGCKYPLKNARLSRRDAGLGVSNEIEGNCTLISVKKGAIYIIESRDAK